MGASPNNEDAVRCAESAYHALSEDDQRVLVCFAPFTSAVSPTLLDGYLPKLRSQPALAAFALSRWKESIGEARKHGLLCPHPGEPSHLSVPPAVTALLRNRPEFSAQTETRLAIDTAFREVYGEFMEVMHMMFQSTVPEFQLSARDVVRLEYDNMVMAMDIALSHRVAVEMYYSAIYHSSCMTGHRARGLELAQRVASQLEEYPPEDLAGRAGDNLASVIDTIGDYQRSLGQYEAAEASYRRALASFLASKSRHTSWMQAGIAATYQKLGLLACDSQRWPEAEDHFQESLRISIEGNDQASQASVYYCLGLLAAKQHHAPQAEQHYQRAMELFGDDRFSQAKVLYDWAELGGREAGRHYRRALTIFREFEDRDRMATTHFHLGERAHERGRWEEAEKHYRRARMHFFALGNHRDEGAACSRLALLAKDRGHVVAARRYFQRALRLFQKINDREREATAHHALGKLALQFGRRKTAKRHLCRAREMHADLDDPCGLAEIELDLGFLAYQQQRWQDAQDLCLAALRTFVTHRNRSGRKRALMDLAPAWQKTNDPSLPDEVASLLGTTGAKARAIFRKMASSVSFRPMSMSGLPQIPRELSSHRAADVNMRKMRGNLGSLGTRYFAVLFLVPGSCLKSQLV